MSDDKKVKSCTITTFYSPYLFWVVFDQDISKRNDLQSYLNQGNKKWNDHIKPQIGELVLVCFEEEWCRAEIIEIKNNYSCAKRSNIFVCFLVDYGRFITVYRVYKLPQEWLQMPRIATKGILYGLSPYVTIAGQKEIDWLPGIRYLVENIISSRKLQYFFIEQQSNDVFVGDVILENDKSEKCSLSKEIIGRNFAIFDPSYDISQIEEHPMSQIHSLAVYVVGLKQTGIESIGSVSARSLEAMSREMNKRAIKIRDNYFEDIEKVLTKKSHKKGHKTAKRYATKKIEKSDSVMSVDTEATSSSHNVTELNSLHEPLGRGRPRERVYQKDLLSAGRARTRNIHASEQKSGEIFNRSKSIGRNFRTNEKIDAEKFEDSDGENYNYQRSFEFNNSNSETSTSQQHKNKKKPKRVSKSLERSKISTPNTEMNPQTARKGILKTGTRDFDEEPEHEKVLLKSINNEKTVSSGRGFRKVFKSDNKTDKVVGKDKSKKSELKDLPKSIDTGRRSSDFDDFDDFDADINELKPSKDLTESSDEKLKTSGRGFRKSESESDKETKSIGRGRRSTDFDDENYDISNKSVTCQRSENETIKTSGRGFRKSLKSDSESDKDAKSIGRGRRSTDFDDNEIKSTKDVTSFDNEKLKTSGRGFKKLLKSESNSEKNVLKSIGRGRKSTEFDEENYELKYSSQDLVLDKSTEKLSTFLKSDSETKSISLGRKSTDFDEEHFEDQDLIEKSKTSGCTFKKTLKSESESDKEAPKSIAKGRQSTEFDEDDFEISSIHDLTSSKSFDCEKLNTSGHGFMKTLKSESESDKEAPKSIAGRKSTEFDEEDFEISSNRDLPSRKSFDNDKLKTSGSGFKKTLKSESESDKEAPKTIAGRKSTEFDEEDFEISSNKDLTSSKSFDNEKLKTSGRGFKKTLKSESESDKEAPKSIGRGKFSDFNKENKDFDLTSGRRSGHGFRKTLKSDSESDKEAKKSIDQENFVDFEENIEVKSKLDLTLKCNNDNKTESLEANRETKQDITIGNGVDKLSLGRGFSKMIKSESESEKESVKSATLNSSDSGKSLKKSDTDTDTSFQSFKSNSSSDYQDARTSDSDSKKSLFRVSPIDEVIGYASGASIYCRPKVQKSNFHEGKNQIRPPQKSEFTKHNNQDYESRERKKNFLGLCDCRNCDSWRNKDCVFEVHESEIPEIKEPKIVQKPPLLFKSEGDKIEVPFQKNREFSSETEKKAAPRLLVHSHFALLPVHDLTAVAFHENVQKALRSLNYTSAYSIQIYTWPAVLRAHSIIIVSVPDCGKTMVYVPALCSFLHCKRDESLNKNGPKSIVLCPTVSVVEDVSKLFNSILKRIDKDDRLLSIPYFNTGIAHKLNKYNYDIIVTTPRVFIKLYKDDLISLQRLCHVVLEEGHLLFSLFQRELDYIMHKVNNVLENRTTLVEIQIITISQEWNKRIESFAKKFRCPPIVCIGAHLEAALYGRANIKVQLCNEIEKAEKVINLIKDEYKTNKTLIICNDMEIPRALISILDTNKMPFETLLLNAAIEEINCIKNKWMQAGPEEYFILICSDNIFNTGLAITDANIIVQYSLPENWSQFTLRFSGFLDNYTSPLNTATEDMKMSMMHIMMDNVNIKPYPKLLNFLKRMKTKITEGMTTIYENLQKDFEKEKIENNISLCEKLLCFDACKDTYTCKYRHMLCPKLDISPIIPKSGLLKLKVLHVESPIKYNCRLLTHTDSDNVTHEISDQYALIAAQLLATKDKLEPIPFKQIKVGMVYAVQEIEGISKGNFQRGKVMEDAVYVGFNNKKVLVRYIDLGFDQVVQTSQLYKLPSGLEDFPPQSVTVYLADIAPLDYDTTWAQKFMVSFKREIRKCGYSQINCFFTGRIKLQIGEAIFMDDLKLQELVEDDSIVIHKMSVKSTLRKMKGISKINHLQKLYNLCEKSNIPLQNYYLPITKIENKTKPQIKPDWAHLENLKEFNEVYFVCSIDPNAFFVRLSTNNSLLNQLHKDILEAIQKPHYPTIQEPIIGQCYALYSGEDAVYARIIVKEIKSDIVDCFFVDYGDMIEVHKNELKFLPDEFITRLPFQAIECKLYGLEPANENWTEEANDILYCIAYEPKSDPSSDILRYLYVKIMDNEPAQYTSFKKYSVILADIFEHDTVINNVFVEQKIAVPIVDYPIKIDFDKLRESLTKKMDSEDEIEKVEIEEIIRTDEDEEMEEINDDDKWDLQINNPEEFFRMLCIPLKKITDFQQSNDNNEPQYSIMKALPRPNHSTPEIIWQQTDSHVTMRIQIPGVQEYETHISRSRIFMFRTQCNEINYALNLTLFAKVHNFEHSNMGLYVLVRVKKNVEQEWPKLIFGKEKMRNIKYNVVAIPVDEESDDDRPLTQKMIQSSKTLGTEMNKILDDENAPYIFEYGSDIDWDESDIASDSSDVC